MDSNEAEESQGSQELARLLASGRPVEESQDEEPATPYHYSSDSLLHIGSDDQPHRKYSLMGLGQGLPLSQTQHLDESDEQVEVAHGSQKENYYSSTDSSKLGPNVLCPKNLNKSQVFDHVSLPSSASDMAMVDTYGASPKKRLLDLKNHVTSSPARPVCQESQSSDGSQVGFDLQQDDDENDRQVVEQYDMRYVREPDEPQTDEPPEEEPTQPDQSTQPLDSDDGAVKDDEWSKITGIQVPPQKRGRYLPSGHQGVALATLRDDTFFDSSAPGTPDQPQYPAGMPSQDSSQEVETQLAEQSQQEETSWSPPIQYPAGFGPPPGEEDTATQILETETQLADDYESAVCSAPPPAPPIAVAPNPSLPPAPAFLPSPNAMEIVPDSEPPVPSPAKSPLPPVQRSKSVHAATPQKRVPVDNPNPMDMDTEDDEPLAATTTATIAKPGPRKAAGVKGDTSATQMPPPLPKRSAKAEGKQKQVAPLLDDQETALPATRSSKRKAAATTAAVKSEPSTKRKGKQSKAKATTKAPAKLPVPLRKSTRPTRNQRALVESDSDQEDDVDDEALVVKEEEDRATELGEEDYMTPGPFNTGKRKRGGASYSTSVPRKAFKAGYNQTPAQRSARSHTGSTLSVNVDDAILNNTSSYQVLGLSVTNGHWYPGIIIKYGTDSWKIKFNDNSAEMAKIGSMVAWELRVGDVVKHMRDVKTKKTAQVKEVKEEMALVTDEGGRVFDLPYDKLCVPPEQVEIQWKDRFLTGKELAAMRDKASYSVTQSTLRDDADEFLRGCGIIITSNPKAHAWNKEKSDIFASMIENGASLIEDWTDALQLSGKYIYDRDDDDNDDDDDEDDDDREGETPIRWKILKKDVEWFQDLDEPGSLQRVFVIADTLCQKPKYLVALALGVPCLSTKWMTDNFTHRQGKDWSGYLLPQGICTSTVPNARLSQSVNLDWGTSPQHLQDIMDNPHATKLFEGLSILCVGDDYIPSRDKNRKGAVNDHENGLRTIANRSEMTSGVALIILAMGASKVVAVASLKDAPKAKARFDYVVFKDSNWKTKVSVPKDSDSEGPRYVSWAWVKQSLICGKRLAPMY